MPCPTGLDSSDSAQLVRAVDSCEDSGCTHRNASRRLLQRVQAVPLFLSHACPDLRIDSVLDAMGQRRDDAGARVCRRRVAPLQRFSEASALSMSTNSATRASSASGWAVGTRGKGMFAKSCLGCLIVDAAYSALERRRRTTDSRVDSIAKQPAGLKRARVGLSGFARVDTAQRSKRSDISKVDGRV
jgi:hypothetical protein